MISAARYWPRLDCLENLESLWSDNTLLLLIAAAAALLQGLLDEHKSKSSNLV